MRHQELLAAAPRPVRELFVSSDEAYAVKMLKIATFVLERGEVPADAGREHYIRAIYKHLKATDPLEAGRFALGHHIEDR